MSVSANPVIGAMVRRDGKLSPIIGADPSTQWTYRPEPERTEAKPLTK